MHAGRALCTNLGGEHPKQKGGMGKVPKEGMSLVQYVQGIARAGGSVARAEWVKGGIKLDDVGLLLPQ